jgi:hypothetical protein
MNFSASFITLLLVISLLVFAVLINTTVIYAQQIATKTQQTPSSSSTPKLHAIKITSPTKGQEVSIGKDLTVSGIYTTGNATTSHCQVFVIANGVKPYQPATAAGTGGAAGYSKWNFVLTSKYTTIKQGPNNKITAKYVCSDNPSIASFYSVNITGVETTTKQQQQNVTTTTSNNNNTIPTSQNKPVVFNNSRSTILPYPISKNANQVSNTTFLGNDGIGNVSGIEYLGYHEPSSSSKNYSPIATGGSGSSGSSSKYLGYHEPSSSSKNYSPIATGGSGSSGSDHLYEPKAPKAALHSHISSSYNGGSGSRDGVPIQQETSVTMVDNTSIAALFPIGNNSTGTAESASTARGSTEFGFNIFPFD